jgi:hypothetical protein
MSEASCLHFSFRQMIQFKEAIEVRSVVTLPASVWDGCSFGLVALNMYRIQAFIN